MKKWKVPVVWKMSGFVEIEAPTLEKALETVKRDPHIELPEGEYVDSSFDVGMDGDIDIIRELYNDLQKDEYDVCKGIENVVYDWLSHQKDAYNLDITTPDYARMMKLVEGLCEDEFPELAESIFGSGSGTMDLIFKDRNNPQWYNLFYYNPDSSRGGLIEQCPFHYEDASEMIDNEDYMGVLEAPPHYLSDVDSQYFFDTVFELIEMKKDGLFLGCDVSEVCRGIVGLEKSVDMLIGEAEERSATTEKEAAKDTECEFPIEAG